MNRLDHKIHLYNNELDTFMSMWNTIYKIYCNILKPQKLVEGGKQYS
jgi:hypothetical protein